MQQQHPLSQLQYNKVIIYSMYRVGLRLVQFKRRNEKSE